MLFLDDNLPRYPEAFHNFTWNNTTKDMFATCNWSSLIARGTCTQLYVSCSCVPVFTSVAHSARRYILDPTTISLVFFNRTDNTHVSLAALPEQTVSSSQHDSTDREHIRKTTKLNSWFTVWRQTPAVWISLHFVTSSLWPVPEAFHFVHSATCHSLPFLFYSSQKLPATTSKNRH